MDSYNLQKEVSGLIKGKEKERKKERKKERERKRTREEGQRERNIEIDNRYMQKKKEER